MIRYFIISYISHHRLILILYLFHIYRGLCKKLLNWLEVGSRTSTSVVLVAWCWCILLVTMPVSNSQWHNDRDTCFCVLVSGVVVCVRREAAAAMPIVHRLRFATSSRYMPPQPLLRRCLLLPWQHALWRYVMLTLTLLLYCHTMLPGDRRSVVTTACCCYWCRYAARHDLFAAYVFQLSVLSARHCCRRFCLCCQHLFWQKLPPPPIMLMEIVCWNQCTLVCMYVWVCVCIVKSWRGAMVPERVGAPFRQIFFSQNGAPVIIVSSQVECWRCSVLAQVDCQDQDALWSHQMP